MKPISTIALGGSLNENKGLGWDVQRKRLQHHADTLCHMFCGWQLGPDYKALTGMGSGALTIEVLQGTCMHNGADVEPLKMVEVLRTWLVEDLERHDIPVDSILKATLTVEFQTDRHVGQRDKSTQWARPTKEFISCELRCSSQVVTEGKTYTSAFTDHEEWPSDFGGWA